MLQNFRFAVYRFMQKPWATGALGLLLFSVVAFGAYEWMSGPEDPLCFSTENLARTARAGEELSCKVNDEILNAQLMSPEAQNGGLKTIDHLAFAPGDLTVRVYMSNGSVGVMSVTNDTAVNRLIDKARSAHLSMQTLNAGHNWFTMFIAVGIPLLMIGAIIWSGMGRGVKKMGNSTAQQLVDGLQDVTLADVGGCKAAKDDIQDILDYLKDPKKFGRLGGKTPRGVLLIGPPGNGKTLFARAVAGVAGVGFFHMSGSESVEMFVGVGASRLRDLWKKAVKFARRTGRPVIIFVDEIDSLAANRGSSYGGGADEKVQTLNQLLALMDGLAGKGKKPEIIVIAATNRYDMLDKAVVRPGRFDRKVFIENPGPAEREEILAVALPKIKTDNTVTAKALVPLGSGMSGADLVNWVNEAALLAEREGAEAVGKNHFDRSWAKVVMGERSTSLIMTEEEKLLTAYHEGGHALAMIKSGRDLRVPVNKVSIVPRSRSLGVTVAVPLREQVSLSFASLKQELDSLLGGRQAELLVYGNEGVTTGCASDLDRATKIVEHAITKGGFGTLIDERLGVRSFGGGNMQPFAVQGDDGDFSQTSLSQETRTLLDGAISKMLNERAATTTELLGRFRAELDAIATALLKVEEIDRQQLLALIAAVEAKRANDETDLTLSSEEIDAILSAPAQAAD